MYSGAFGPISIATAPAPPVGRALPDAYIAMSAAITTANRPIDMKQILSIEITSGQAPHHPKHYSPPMLLS